MNLIPYRPHTVKHLIGQTADQMLSGVHSHVCISGLPIDCAANLIADFELVIFAHRVMDLVSPANF